MTLKIGDTYHKGKLKVKILSIQGNQVKFEWSSPTVTYTHWEKNTLLEFRLSRGNWIQMEPTSKPLDEAFKQLDKQFCVHKNTRRDQFFTAMVYITCKDCGKPLN